VPGRAGTVPGAAAARPAAGTDHGQSQAPVVAQSSAASDQSAFVTGKSDARSVEPA
jgi:hypothetical protein